MRVSLRFCLLPLFCVGDLVRFVNRDRAVPLSDIGDVGAVDDVIEVETASILNLRGDSDTAGVTVC